MRTSLVMGLGASLAFALPVAATAATKSAKPAPRKPTAPRLPVGQVKLPPLSYTVDASGPATGAHPKRSDTILVNYTLTLLDGTVVDKSEGGVSFPLNRLIPAWQILIQLMRPGDKWTFYVPPEYGYGSIAREKLPANSFLIFKVELVGAGEDPA